MLCPHTLTCASPEQHDAVSYAKLCWGYEFPQLGISWGNSSEERDFGSQAVTLVDVSDIKR